MPNRVKSLLIWILVVFTVYAVAVNPENASEVARSVWQFIVGAFSGFGRFVTNVTS